MNTRSIVVMMASVAALTACAGMRDALTAHVDVVARAGDAELTVTRLAELMGNSPIRPPVSRDVANVITNLWVDYHLLAISAANDDSLKDPKLIDEASSTIMANIRLRRFMEKAIDSTKVEAPSEATYGQATGNLFVARHILFATPGGATQQQKDSVRRKAESVRAQVTPANFGGLARRYSADPGSAQRGGDLGAFPRGDMVKPFGDAVAALRPGQISPLVETQFGYHIIMRPTYADARAEYDSAFQERARRGLDSVYLARVDSSANVQLRSNAAGEARDVARDPRAHVNDDAPIATFNGGSMTAGRFARWVQSFPPQMRVSQQLQQAPDTVVRSFVTTVARNEVLLKKADSANVQITAEEKQDLYSQFKSLVITLWQQLEVDPRQLADSAHNVPERVRLAHARADSFLDHVLAGQAQPLSVPEPVENVLSAKFKTQVNPAGLDRAVERATKLRATADSARAAQQPRSRIPIPPAPAPDSTRSDAGRPRTKTP